MVKFEVQILRVSEILTLGSVLSAGRVAFLPRRFLKCLEKFSIRFSAEPPLILIDVLEFLPASSLIVFQARWCCLLMCWLDRESILPLIKST